MKRQTLHMPACLENLQLPQKKRRETAAVAAARKALNARLEDAAVEIEKLSRDMPNWRAALSSAAERVRAKKINYGEL